VLKKNQIEAKFVQTYNQTNDDGEDLWIVIWNGLRVLPKRCIIYNMDPMVPHIESEFKSLINRSTESNILRLVDYCHGLNPTKWTNLPYPQSVLVYGFSPYHSYLKSHFVDPNQKQDIDILFYGNVTGRRIPIIIELNKLAQARNYVVMIRHYDLFDEIEKIRTIARAKVVVSFGSADTIAFHGNDLARSAQVISSGGFIITEYLGDSVVEPTMESYVPHYRTTEQFIELVDYYLKNPEKRREMQDLASQRFCIDFNLEKDLLNLVSETTAHS
jgi:spore maturation protein CgeB